MNGFGVKGFGIRASALNEGVGDIIRSIFADGTDGFYFDFSKTDGLFQAVTAETLADDAGESIAFGLDRHSWLDKTYAQLLASQPELIINGDFSSDVGWTNTATGIISGGKFTASGIANGEALGRAAALTPNAYHRGAFTIDSIVSGSASMRLSNDISGTSEQAGATRTTTGSFVDFLRAGAANDFQRTRFGLTTSIQMDDVSVKALPGNHSAQATGAAQPKWQTGGLARFDGSDDNLLTTLVPGTAMTYGVKIKAGASNTRVFLGSTAGGNTRSWLQVALDGRLAGGVGAQDAATIVGGSDIRGSTIVGFVTFDGSVVSLYLNGTVIYTGAQSGSPTTTIATAVGALNASGTPSVFTDGDIYHALAIKKALTAAQIAAITTLWGTT
jgi:hypothetical protein